MSKKADWKPKTQILRLLDVASTLDDGRITRIDFVAADADANFPKLEPWQAVTGEEE